MKFWAKALTVVVAVLMAGMAYGADNQALRTDKEKTSYAIGAQTGADMRHFGIEVDPDLVARGFRDAYSGRNLLLNDQQMSETLAGVSKIIAAKSPELMKQDAERNKQEGEAFLAQNARKDGVRTLPSGLQYRVMKTGTGRTPRLTDTVVVNYRGTFIDGTEFDSSYRGGQPFVFQVNKMIKGWVEALQMMSVGAKWQLFIPPRLAYGEQGQPPAIGPSETLIYEVELLSIK
ncbi:MAG TPA: FKBP-type peptidyl-prolyl cis-trans isomerase [Syntrophorhabdales bacterium]|nr:FKBP-type peptidyl-prolyl cis-trans isomerase [Syntrophorhabdales bacterium]